ncbi:MAG: hypothetical protein IPP94_07810 [Ignavibacteria bacterium]|nr:hypothetical protein [Ignavibacteria bacterium]
MGMFRAVIDESTAPNFTQQTTRAVVFDRMGGWTISHVTLAESWAGITAGVNDLMVTDCSDPSSAQGVMISMRTEAACVGLLPLFFTTTVTGSGYGS